MTYALIVLCLTPSIPTFAGDSGTPAIPPSDANYLVFYHGDHLGSAQLITEGKPKGRHAGIIYKRGDVIQRFEYAAYGRESFVLNPNLAWDPAFTGQQYDIETGLYYYRARYYNPILGRFIQPDTVVQDVHDPQSWNRYAYVRNNPLKYTDPTGHAPHFDMPNDYDNFVHGVDRDNDSNFHFNDSADFSGHEGGLIGAVAVVSFAINSMTGGHSEQVIGAGKSLLAGAAWLLDTLQSRGPKVQLSAEEEMMMDFVMGFSMGGGIKVVGSELAAGLRAMGRGSAASASSKTIVIGENMPKRVVPYAEKIGADYYKAKPWANPENWMKNNAAWIRKQMRKGVQIIDIGPDQSRRIIKGPSPYYEMEKAKIQKWNYQEYKLDPQP